MDTLVTSAKNLTFEMVAIGTVFALLALVTKRRSVLAAWRRCRREAGTNVGLLIVNTLVLLPLFAVPVDSLHRLIGAPRWLIGLWQWPGPVAVLITTILANEFAVYWRHRFEHSRWLWRFHATHHADEHLHWLSVMRKHPVSHLLSHAVDILPLLLLGLPPWAVAMAALLRSWWGYFIHADVPWTLGSFGKVMISPAAHRLHHARDEALAGTNFGGFFTLWDRLFGTYCDPTPYLDCPTGIADGSRSLLGELARPFEGAGARLRRRHLAAQRN